MALLQNGILGVLIPHGFAVALIELGGDGAVGKSLTGTAFYNRIRAACSTFCIQIGTGIRSSNIAFDSMVVDQLIGTRPYTNTCAGNGCGNILGSNFSVVMAIFYSIVTMIANNTTSHCSCSNSIYRACIIAVYDQVICVNGAICRNAACGITGNSTFIIAKRNIYMGRR